jgi:hypothetical protein
MGDHDMLRRLQAGEALPLAAFTRGHDPITQMVMERGGLFAFTKAFARGELRLPLPHQTPHLRHVSGSAWKTFAM